MNTLINDIALHPLGLIIVALASAFLLPLIYGLHRGAGRLVFHITMFAMVFIAGFNLADIIQGGSTIIIDTAGYIAPYSIQLRFGAIEGGLILAVNTIALLAGWHLMPKIRDQASAMLMYIIMIMGIDGVIMTRDLFNLFIFIEITSLATYSLIALERGATVLAAGFKYIIATSIATTFFLIGTIFIYYQTGSLNIDDIIANQASIQGPVGLIASLFLITSMIIELKPYPANGWGLDVYQSAPSGVASMISVGVSAGVLFAIYKLLPLMMPFIDSLALIGALTFLFSNIIGLKQHNVRRLLGYSSIGQMGLMLMAMALLAEAGLDERAIWFIVGGLFLNHLLAKAGLFWLAEVVDREDTSAWSVIKDRPILIVLMATLLIALVGLPPFPGFFAKWQLVMELSVVENYVAVALILIGSLFEAAYLFRWFTNSIPSSRQDETTDQSQSVRSRFAEIMPIIGAAALLLASGTWMASTMTIDMRTMFLPLLAGIIMAIFDTSDSRSGYIRMLALLACGGYLLMMDLDGLLQLFAFLFLAGGALVSMGSYACEHRNKHFFSLLTILLLSLTALMRTQTTLEFFFLWELMTLSSWMLVASGRNGSKPSFIYLMFSLASAYFILTGFAVHHATFGNYELLSTSAESSSAVVFYLLAAGFLMKLGAFGVHVWLPGSYAEADDDFTAVLSSVVSKVGVFGLIVASYHLGVEADLGLNPAYLLAWIGILTATFGALMAVFQEDLKMTVAYSSMGQLGYIITGVALMNHLGWVTALYMTVNHFLFKGILFLSVAGIIMRTNERMMYRMGGLIKNMPFSFVFTMIAIIAMSGVPPLSGFGGKWLLFNGLMEQGWHFIAAFAFFSSAVAFLYMFRILQTVFLGQRKLEHHDLKEAPLMMLIPQFVLVGIIMVISFYPKLLLDLLSVAVAPWIAGELVWEGTALLSHYGYWNAPMIMMVVGGIWITPLIILLLITMTLKIQKVEQFNIVYAAERPDRPENTHFAWNFFAHYDRAIGFLVRPRATAFYDGLSEWVHSFGSSLRIFYNGNGQTYALFILIYFVAMVALNGGLMT